ncbi:MAG TPA: HAD family hydrolase [Anaerolineaceae bacterium]
MLFRNFEVALFDLGGTLIYFDGERPDIIAESDWAMQDWLEKAGYRLPQDFGARFTGRVSAFLAGGDPDFIEITSSYFLKILLAEAGYPSVPDQVVHTALKVKFAISQEHWKLEDDAITTLESLKRHGLRMGLVSNAGDTQDVETLIDKHRLRPYFEQVVISAQVGIRKPNPGIFQLALDHFKTAPENVAMVGDTLGADILGAQNAGIASIWITRRAERSDNRAHEDTIRPDAVIASLSELPPLLFQADSLRDSS